MRELQIDKLISEIADWLATYKENSRTSGFVIGVSGGIDSAVASTLCATTGLPTLGVSLPIHQSDSEFSRATEHLNWLKENFDNVSVAEMDLSETFDSFKDSAPTSENKDLEDLSFANVRSRLRMVALYHYAQINGYLVVGTGNKIEDFGIGFYTKYGDGGVDINPLADLWKSEVYKIARELKLPQSIVDAAPTDGLFGDSRTDEEQIGATYDELEWAMHAFEQGKDPDSFVGRRKEVMEIFTQRHRANQHKMKPIPYFKVKK